MDTLQEVRKRYGDGELDPFTYDAEDADFTPERAQAAVDKIFSLGEVRRKALEQLIKLDRFGQYEVPYTNKGYGASFYSTANHEHFKKKFPWLRDKAGGLCIDVDDLHDTEGGQGGLDRFLCDIPHEDWESFLEDVAYVKENISIDDDRAFELEQEECTRWMQEDGWPNLVEHLMEYADDSYEAYLFSKITLELVWEWSRETDHYPETQGESSVWMDMEKYAKDVDTHTWFLDHLDDDQAEWLALKKAFYEERDGAAAKQFDRMLKSMAQDDERAAHAFNQLDNDHLWNLFLKAFPDEVREEGAPYWYLFKHGYGDDKVQLWRAGYDPLNDYEPALHDGNAWQRTYSDALVDLSQSEWFYRELLGHFDRRPKEHPELKLESEADDPEAYLHDLPSRQAYLKQRVDGGTCTHAQAVEYACLCAESVLHIFEQDYPQDHRPRQAIEAARRWLAEPTEANRQAAYDAADAAYAAAAEVNAANAGASAAAAAYIAYAAAEKAGGAALPESIEDEDDPERFLKMGGLAEDLVYEDDLIRVMSPRDINALNHHLLHAGLPEISLGTWRDAFRSHTVLAVQRKEAVDLTGHVPLREHVILRGDMYGFTVFNSAGGLSREQLKVAGVLKEQPCGPSIRKALVMFCREQVERDDGWGVALLQVGGLPEIRRADRRGWLNLENFKLIIGLQYALRRQFALAAKTLGRDPATVTADGAWLVYSSPAELSPLFKDEDTADSALSDDMDSWFDYWFEGGNQPKVEDVLPYLSAESIAHIREVMVNRYVWFPDGGPEEQGEWVLLTKRLLDGYDDKTLLGWLESPTQEDEDAGTFDDIREAIQLSGCEMLAQGARNAGYTGFIKAAVGAIDGKKNEWDKFTTKKGGTTFSVLVPWQPISVWAHTYQEETGSVWDGDLEDLALEANKGTLSPDIDNLQSGWQDVKKEWAVDCQYRISELEVPDVPDAPLGHPNYLDPKQQVLPLGEAAPEGLDDPEAYLSDLPSRQSYLKQFVDAKTCTKEQAVEYAIICAESVLHLFEKVYPKDDRPRKAIEAARRWLAEPTEANRQAAYAAADSAYVVAAYAANAAHWAVNAAANAAYAAAANAAHWAAYVTYAATAATKAAKARRKLPEALDDVDRPEMMSNLMSGIPAGLERQITACIKDGSESGGYTATDIRMEREDGEDDGSGGWMRFHVWFKTEDWHEWDYMVKLIKRLENLVAHAFRDDYRFVRSYFSDQSLMPESMHMEFVLHRETEQDRELERLNAALIPF